MLLLLRLDYLRAFAGVDNPGAADPESVRHTDPACPLPRSELDDFAALRQMLQAAPSDRGGVTTPVYNARNQKSANLAASGFDA